MSIDSLPLPSRSIGVRLAARLLLACLLALLGSALAGQSPAAYIHPHKVRLASATSSPSGHRKSPAIELLRRTLTNAGKFAYTGQQTVITFDGGNGEAVVTQEKHFGHRRNRILFENPPSLRGQISISDGRCRRLYMPPLQTIVESRLSVVPNIEPIISEHLARIQHSYRLVLYPGLDDVDGRAAYHLDLLAKRPDRYWQKLWIDKATGMILRRETYNPNNTQRSVSSWRNIRLLKPNEVLNPDLTLPKALKVSRPTSDQATYLLSKARKLGGTWAIVPQSLGDGFEFESACIVSSMGKRGLSCEYSDGLISISLDEVQGQQGLYVDPSEGKVLPTPQTGSRKIKVIASGLFLLLSWTESALPRTFSLVSDVPESTLLAIARSLP